MLKTPQNYQSARVAQIMVEEIMEDSILPDDGKWAWFGWPLAFMVSIGTWVFIVYVIYKAFH